jgi:ectoine hydroxylase-related dioxygenase (phytanoyl-CoA dioxygenase family)
MGGLSPRRTASFLENGYLVLEHLLSPEDLQPLIDEIEAVIDRKAREAYAEGRLSDLFEDEPFDRRLACLCETIESPGDIRTAVMGRNLKAGMFGSAGMFRVITHPKVLDIVESVIGPEILAHPQFNLQAKMPREEMSKVPWHQDLEFLESDAKETFMVNVWIPLVDATVENGCLQVISGSHKAGLISHGKLPNYRTRGVKVDNFPCGAIQSCPILKGGAVVFQNVTVHRSFLNRTEGIRWTVDLRYSDPGLSTGRDEISGFTARSRAHPETVIKNHEEWASLMPDRALLHRS